MPVARDTSPMEIYPEKLNIQSFFNCCDNQVYFQFLLLNVLLVFILLFLQTTGKSNSQPHILFMLADDLGWFDVGFHGSNIHTPNIDRLAKEGVILNNNDVEPVCTPTRGALMTGRYPISHTGEKRRFLNVLSDFSVKT